MTLPPPPDHKLCDECGTPFYPKRCDQIFCSIACKATRHKRRSQGGAKLYDAVMKWRIERPKEAMAELTFIADQLAHEERQLRKKRDEAARIAEKEMKRRAAA